MSQISVFLSLEAGGSAIAGNSSVDSIAGVDVSQAIECLSYDGQVSVGYDPRSGAPTGDRTYDPIRITKWVDRASPELANAATRSKPCVAEFKFFRPVSDGEGFEHFFTVKIEDARVQKLRHFVPEGEASAPVKEAVELVFGKITWKHEVENTEHEDSWRQRSAA